MKTKIRIAVFTFLLVGLSTIIIKAKEARICDSIWTVTYSGSVGTSTHVSCTCTTGGEYKCPLCIL